MALHFVNEPSAGASIGNALGTGIGSALNLLAQHKLQEVMEQKQIQNNEKFIKAWNPGLSNEQVSAFARSPEFVQKAIFERGITAPESNQPQYAPQEQQQYQPQQQEQQFVPEQASKPALTDVLKMLYGAGGQAPGQTPVAGIEPKGKPEVRQQILKQAAKQQVAPEVAPVTGVEAAAKQGGFKLGPTPEDRRHQEKIEVQREAATKKEIADQYKATKEIRHEIVEKAKSARQDLKDLERLEELEKEGKLDTPGYVEFLNRAGLDIPALSNPGSEEFKKIESNFLRNAKQYFGGRISNYEVEQFLKTIPSLSQSPEGRKRVIANLKYVSRAALEHNNALKEVVAENRGIPPYDLEERVDEKVEKRMDSIYKKFKEDLAKPVPKGQNKFITALQAGAGSALKPLAGAVLGGISGSKLGPIGAVGGAALGGLAGLKGLI